MRYPLLLLLLLGLSMSRLRGQSIEPGYLVLSNGDTLRGEVENAFWEDPPTTVRFRAAPTAPLTTYSDVQLRGLGLSSGRLLRLEMLPIDRSAETAVGRLGFNLKSRQKPEQVLADVLVQGPATLLAVTLNNVHHYFVRREEQPYMEMTERNYLTVKNSKQVVADGNDYKSQLLRYFGDCQVAVAVSATAPFTTKGLTDVIQAYNQQCSATRQAGQTTSLGTKPHSRVALRWGALVGVRYNSVSFEGVATDIPLDGLNADGRGHALFGGYADVVNGGRRVALHSALQVTRFGRRQPVTFQFRNQNGPQTGSFIWNGTQVFLQAGLRFFLPVGEQTQILLGTGYEVNSFWNYETELVTGASKYSFLGSFAGTPLPYVETGFMRNRLGIALNSRVYASQYYANHEVMIWSANLSLSYRLNADTDKAAAPTR